ncbi:MAG TPA: hypothetical protein VF843_16215 [Streptosporangiaceae bacterium]
MAEGLVLQFAGIGEADYDAVNSRLDFNPRTGEGNWPAGLLHHAAGASDSGWVVTEIWESRQAQGDFMASRLGPALAGMPEPAVTWFGVVADQHRH